MTSQASSPARGCQSRSPGAAGSLSSWGFPGRTCIMNLASVSGARGSLVAGQHHHELCRREGVGLEQVQVSNPRRHWAQPGSQRDRAWSGRRRLTVKVHSAVPIEIHFLEHLIQLRTHQWLPQQSGCCLPQLCHRDPPIPVPVKLQIRQNSALLPSSFARRHLAWTPPLPPSKPSSSSQTEAMNPLPPGKSSWVYPPAGSEPNPL